MANGGTKRWLLEILPLVVVVSGATWWVSSAIGDVRTELHEDISALEVRMVERIGDLESRISGVEGKLDVIIRGLNISAPVAEDD